MADVEALSATLVHCPQCNAVLQVTEGAATATCEYCGTSARIQRRTSLLQRKVPLPARAEDEPVAIAPQVFKPGFRFYSAIVAPLVIPAVVILGLYLVAATSAQWMGGPPLVADVDGDGVDDVIGSIRYVHADKITLAAYSGADGHRLWETASLGSYRDLHSYHPALAGDVVLHNDRRGLSGYAVKTGALRWRVRASDVVDRMCASTPGEIVIRAATGEWSTLALENGVMQGTTAPATCRPLITTANPIEADVIPTGTVRVAGMQIQSVIAHGDGPRIAFGVSAPGTPKTTIAAIDADGAMRWRATIPQDDRLVAGLQVSSFALDDRDVALVYWHDSPLAPELVVFDRATGARRFDVALEKTKSTAEGLALTRTAVAVSQWGNLQIYDRATGHEKFSIP